MREDLSTQEFPSLVGKTFNMTPKGVETSFLLYSMHCGISVLPIVLHLEDTKP